MNDNRFLMEVYRESGEYARNVTIIRNTFLSLYVVALAAFIGLLAQGERPVDSRVWSFPAAISLFGLMSIPVLWRYVHAALLRQDRAANLVLKNTPQIVKYLNLEIRKDYGTFWQALRNEWRGNLQIEALHMGLYGASLLASIAFSSWRDPFGLTA